jgi:hypothetical protein
VWGEVKSLIPAPIPRPTQPAVRRFTGQWGASKFILRSSLAKKLPGKMTGEIANVKFITSSFFVGLLSIIKNTD